ncbi:MAG: YbbR-like domain-containing protein [Bacteroidota bacterium]|nr:YbbR-like domain-containing protein [Bacteroidota bacterium]
MNKESIKYLNTSKKKPSKTSAFFVCLLIASGLWLVHALNTVYNYSLKVPITFSNIPQNKIPLNDLPSRLTLDIKASGLKLLFIVFNKTKPISINFNDLKTNNKQLNYILSSSTINFNPVLKFEVQIKQINPDTLYFTERSGFQKSVIIKVPLQLKCAQGFGYKTPVIYPSSISIWGDTAVIKNIDTVYTEALNLNNLNMGFTKELAIIKPNSNINLNQSKINVSIEVDKLIEQTISIPVTIFNTEEFKQANIFPQKVKVKFTSIQNTFNISDTANFKATIKVSKNAKNNKQTVVLSSFPGNVSVLSIEPKEVEVLLIKK